MDRLLQAYERCSMSRRTHRSKFVPGCKASNCRSCCLADGPCLCRKQVKHTQKHRLNHECSPEEQRCRKCHQYGCTILLYVLYAVYATYNDGYLQDPEC